MYLYKNNKDKSIDVYSFNPNSVKLIEYKKKYLENIKSVILHINNSETKKLLFESPTIMFRALDREELTGKKTYIEDTKNNEVISQYINGKFDSLNPVSIMGSKCESLYSGNIYDEDSTLLFTGGYYSNREFITDEGILLTGCLDLFQPLLSNDINNLIFSGFLDYKDEEVVEFLNLFSCIKERVISLDDLKFLKEKGIIEITDDYHSVLEKSEEVLNSYNMVRRRNK